MAKSASTIERQVATGGMRCANGAVSIEAAAPMARASLRATPKGITAYAKHLGFALPKKPGEVNSKAGRHALWLGPDEWLILDERNPNATLVPARHNNEFAAVDISHRNVAFVLSGSGAANTLNAGCPRDLSLAAFPNGTASRTIFGKAEVVIYRTAENTFHLECWRSFAPYVWTYLIDGTKDAYI